MQLKDIGEHQLIETIARHAAGSHPSIIQGIGDDAAVIDAGAGECFLVTADELNEQVHFSRNSCSPYLIGKKSFSVNASDIAAMGGGAPLLYAVCLSAPPDTPLQHITMLYRGMQARAQDCGGFLIGGDTVASRTGLSISITVIAQAQKETVLYRSGARVNDRVYVTGSLGDSALGLAMLNSGAPASPRHPLLRKHFDPVAQLAAAQELARLRCATSMIDISDGLVGDLQHILNKSGVGADIRLAALPLSRSYRKYCSAYSGDFYRPALCGGEDYELLFTVPPEKTDTVIRCAAQSGVAMTCIGHITKNPSRLMLVDNEGRCYDPDECGYVHF